MWRTRSPSEKWERRKTYLIRSLFEDTPLLSPIYEAPESSSSSSRKDTFYRPDSPLPDLIIEREPKKTSLYDEPEEFYIMLENKIRRLYRRDFLGINETSKSGSIYNIDEDVIEERFTQETKSTTVDETSNNGSIANINEDVIDERFTQETQCTTVDETSKSGSIANIDEDVIEERFTQENKSTTVDETSKSGSIANINEDVIEERFTQETQCTTVDETSKSGSIANIDEDVIEERFTQENKSTTMNETSKSGSTANIDEGVIEETFIRKTKSMTIDERNTGSKERLENLTKKLDVSFENRNSLNSASSSVSSVEIIRRQHTNMDLGSAGDCEVSKSKSNDSLMDFEENIAMDFSELPEESITTNEEIDVANESPITEERFLSITSTPKSTKKLSIRKKSIEKRSIKRLVSYSSSSSSIKSTSNYAQKAFQTSFSDNESNIDNLWSNFFEGIPSVYNLCSCSNHACE